MRKNQKFIIGIIAAIIAFGLLLASFWFASWYKSRSSFTDSNGWVHNIDGTEYGSDPYASLNYVVINSDKAEFEKMSTHQFLQKIIPIFKAYSGKSYVTFAFDDGTGLYWPYADKKNDGIYGTIDETGHLITQEAYVHIEGNEITKEDVSKETTAESVNMYSLLPEDYYTDDAMVSVMGQVLYLNVYFDTASRTYDEVALELWNIYKEADLSKIDTVLIRMNDDVFYEVNARSDESTPVYVENGYEKWASFLYGDSAADDIIDAVPEETDNSEE